MTDDRVSTDAEGVTAIAAVITSVGDVLCAGAPAHPGEDWKGGQLPERAAEVLVDILCMCRKALARDLGVALPD